MTRYHFDVRHSEGVTLDEEGSRSKPRGSKRQFPSRNMHALPSRAEHGSHRVEVEVRDDAGAVLAVKVCFETQRRG
jgi:hypothetical protein